MRLSELLTTRSGAADDSPDLLVRAGYTHRLADGLYTLLPLGQRVLHRINAIVRRELSRAGAQEVTMPLLQPATIWQQRIGGWDTRAESFGPQLFRLSGENNAQPLVLAPTHEEVATILGAACIRDARDLPRLIYQIQPRFRNQPCPVELGLLCTREFVMADAYSFHADRVGLDDCYAAVRQAFAAVASSCGMSARFVAAAAGAIGGHASEELVAPLPAFTSTAAFECKGCGYAASADIAEFERTPIGEEAALPLEEVALAGAEQFSTTKRLVWVPFLAGERLLLAVMPYGSQLNPVKLTDATTSAGIQTWNLHPASAQELTALGANYDWISLVRTPRDVFVVADEAVRRGVNFCMPSPHVGSVLINVNSPRDFRVDMFTDICAAADGAACSRCGRSIRGIQGVEAGHIFKLGSHYADAFGARLAAQSLEMGCYGLGITRLMSTIVRQHQDARGIVWPEAVAPYLAVIVPMSAETVVLRGVDDLYRELAAAGIAVLLDDSMNPPDDRIRYADLLGIPIQILFRTDADHVEIRRRESSESHRGRRSDVRPLLQSRHSALRVEGVADQATDGLLP